MHKEKFLEFLKSLAERQLDHDHLMLDVLPKMVEWLGFSNRDIRFEYPLVFGPSQRIRVADAILVDSETDEPWLVFEVKGRSTRTSFELGRLQLIDVLSASNFFGGMLLTPSELLLISHEPPLRVQFDDLNALTADRLQHRIVEGLRKWRESKSTQNDGGGFPDENHDSDCQKRLAQVKTASTNDEKKKSLESYLEYLINRVPCLRVKHRDLRTTSSEIDLIVENIGGPESSLYDEFGRHFLVECKNWTDRVGAKEVRDFVGKMLKTKQRLGILATRKGVTGANGRGDAIREIEFCYDKLDVVVLVLTEIDMDLICSGVSLTEVLDVKLDRLRFDIL